MEALPCTRKGAPDSTSRPGARTGSLRAPSIAHAAARTRSGRPTTALRTARAPWGTPAARLSRRSSLAIRALGGTAFAPALSTRPARPAPASATPSQCPAREGLTAGNRANRRGGQKRPRVDRRDPDVENLRGPPDRPHRLRGGHDAQRPDRLHRRTEPLLCDDPRLVGSAPPRGVRRHLDPDWDASQLPYPLRVASERYQPVSKVEGPHS